VSRNRWKIVAVEFVFSDVKMADVRAAVLELRLHI
jgi:hypothetical protein